MYTPKLILLPHCYDISKCYMLEFFDLFSDQNGKKLHGKKLLMQYPF